LLCVSESTLLVKCVTVQIISLIFAHAYNVDVNYVDVICCYFREATLRIQVESNPRVSVSLYLTH